MARALRHPTKLVERQQIPFFSPGALCHVYTFSFVLWCFACPWHPKGKTPNLEGFIQSANIFAHRRLAMLTLNWDAGKDGARGKVVKT